MAFCRRVAALLIAPQVDAPPLPLAQPVLYRDAVLRRPIGPYLVGAEAPFLEFNWRTGTARIYLDADDALNRTPDTAVDDAWPACEPRLAREYVAEAAAFLDRGHSLTDPGCTCPHGLTAERAAELGIARHARPSPPCPLPSAPQRCSPERLSLELCLRDLRCARDAEGAPVLDALLAAGHVIAAGPRLSYFASASRHTGPLRGLADLRRAVAGALTLALPPPAEAYFGLEADVDALEAEGVLARLPGGDDPRGAALVARRDPRLAMRVDADLRALWHAHPPRPEERYRPALLLLPPPPSPPRRPRRR